MRTMLGRRFLSVRWPQKIWLCRRRSSRRKSLNTPSNDALLTHPPTLQLPTSQHPPQRKIPAHPPTHPGQPLNSNHHLLQPHLDSHAHRVPSPPPFSPRHSIALRPSALPANLQPRALPRPRSPNPRRHRRRRTRPRHPRCRTSHQLRPPTQSGRLHPPAWAARRAQGAKA